MIATVSDFNPLHVSIDVRFKLCEFEYLILLAKFSLLLKVPFASIFLVVSMLFLAIYSCFVLQPKFLILGRITIMELMLSNLFNYSVPIDGKKDNRGWLFDPVALALASGLKGGALTCASLHVGEIRPGKLRGNHRHHDCNETFLIWGAATRFRLENSEEDNGYAEVSLDRDEIAVAASPVHRAHAIVNIDSVRSTFFIGCQDSIANYSASSEFHVWKDL
ncbi:hypothetical protein Fmac_029529 [Flemingia macrophylla]|uniref:Capsular polysaccharide assembling protein CapF C-terminal domain-containing protein n=1 Tax=Flemingia macrophylla TaxID=520843 RepID=A0ABD1LAM8_9FABA